MSVPADDGGVKRGNMASPRCLPDAARWNTRFAGLVALHEGVKQSVNQRRRRPARPCVLHQEVRDQMILESQGGLGGSPGGHSLWPPSCTGSLAVICAGGRTDGRCNASPVKDVTECSAYRAHKPLPAGQASAAVADAAVSESKGPSHQAGPH